MKLIPTLLAAVAVLCVPASASASGPSPARPSDLEPALPLSAGTIDQIESLMATPPFDQGIWGLQVNDVATGEKLFGLNTDRQFQAASTTKNFTTAATLDALGKNHRFRTPVVHTGRVSRSGVLRGKLVLEASGDLTMGGREKPDGSVDYTGFDHSDSNEVPGPATLTPQDPLAGLNDLARQVKRSGIDRVRGDVVIDDRLWKQQLVNHEVISPIIINDNMIDISMTPTTPGEPVETTTRPATAAYEIDVQARTVAAGQPLAVHVGEVHHGKVVVSGQIPVDADPHSVVQVLRVPRPAYFARSLFFDALRRAGSGSMPSGSARTGPAGCRPGASWSTSPPTRGASHRRSRNS